MNIINLSSKFKPVGWMILVSSTALGIIYMIDSTYLPDWTFSLPTFYINKFLGPNEFFTTAEADILPILIGLGIVVGGNLVGFARETVDDEYLQWTRLKALQYAFIAQSLLFVLTLLFVRELALLTLLMINFFVMVWIFVITSQILLYRSKKSDYAE